MPMAFEESRLLVRLHHVVDGAEALRCLRRETDAFADTPGPDLILLDLNMPRMNSGEFLQEVKRDAGLRSIPVESYDLGATGYIVKSVDLDQWFNAVKGMESYWFTVVKLPQ